MESVFGLWNICEIFYYSTFWKKTIMK